MTSGGGYALEVEPEQIDARRFEHLLDEGRAPTSRKPAGRLAALASRSSSSGGATRSAISVTRTFARFDVERLEELRLVAIEERIDAELALGHSRPTRTGSSKR